MNEITAHNECPADSYDMTIKNWMPTFYWEVRAKFSEEVTSELKPEGREDIQPRKELAERVLGTGSSMCKKP